MNRKTRKQQYRVIRQTAAGWTTCGLPHATREAAEAALDAERRWYEQHGAGWGSPAVPDLRIEVTR